MKLFKITDDDGNEYTAADIDADKYGVRAEKLEELKAACNTAIVSGVDVETAQGTEHFSLTTEDQINISNLAMQVKLGASGALYHADGKLCRLFTADEINALTDAAVRHVTYHTTYFNHLKEWLRRSESDNEAVSVTYGAEPPGDLAASMAALLTGGEA